MSDEELKPQLAILLQDGRTIRLGTPAKWLRAVELGDLTPDTLVEAVRPAGRYEGPASGVPELRLIFESKGLLAVDEAEDGPEEPPEAAAEVVEAPPEETEADDPEAPSGDDKPPSQKADAPAPPPIRTGPRGNSTWIVVAAAIVVAVLGLAFLTSIQTDKPAVEAPAPAAEAVSPPPAELLPPGVTVSWDSAKDVDGKTYSFEGYDIRFTAQTVEEGRKAPVITIGHGADRPLEITGTGWTTDASADVLGGRVDAGTREPALLVSWYTGGAHCCTEAVLVTRGPSGLVARQLGATDYGLKIQDLNNDGIGELASFDERFLYAFGSYAESLAPPWVRTMRDGVITDANEDPAFRSVFEAALPDSQKACLAHSNSGCAAFVAIAARLGRADWAWTLMLANYDRGAAWSYPEGCSVARSGGECPKGQQIVYPDFPTALAGFLTEAGYLSPAPPTPSARPSFDCAGVDSEVLRLICATPELAEADVRLDAAYREAMARTSDADQLRNEQRTWIRLRNNGAADVDRLMRMYEARIALLKTDWPE